MDDGCLVGVGAAQQGFLTQRRHRSEGIETTAYPIAALTRSDCDLHRLSIQLSRIAKAVIAREPRNHEENASSVFVR